MMTTVLFTVTSRHSSIENGALEYLYIPANPFVYRMAAPTNASDAIALQEVADELPPIAQAIHGYALIATANFNHQDFGLLGVYESDFTVGWPAGTDALIANWNAALAAIDAAIDARNAALQVPYTGIKPSRTFNSIWN
jgi:hypothetical protein